jgi:hypothetical protein
MEEIGYHEREARRHLQLADELRRDLRESFAFLQNREVRAKTAPAPVEPRSEPAMTPEVQEKPKEANAPERRQRGGLRKRRQARRRKE